MTDFKPFFEVRGNAKKVYTPSPKAKVVENHAIVLVGYNNEQEYWVARCAAPFAGESMSGVWPALQWPAAPLDPSHLLPRCTLHHAKRRCAPDHHPSSHRAPQKQQSHTCCTRACLLLSYRNSWGPGFADRGYFKVAYNHAAVAAEGDTYGVVFTPFEDFGAPLQPLTPVPGRPKCQRYTVRKGAW